MTLIDLPLEILQLILTHASTPSFLQLISTCHQLWDLASKSREVVLHQIARVPGIKLGLDDLANTTQQLFLILRRRAALNLYGAHLHADRTIYTLRQHAMNVSASCFRTSITNSPCVALVAGENVMVYQITNTDLHPRHKYSLSSLDLQVQKTSFDRSGNVAVVYGRPFRDGSHVLAYHKCSAAKCKPVLFRMDGIAPPLAPISLAVYDERRFAVVLSGCDLMRMGDVYQKGDGVNCIAPRVVMLYELKSSLPIWDQQEQSEDSQQYFSFKGPDVPHTPGGNLDRKRLYPPFKADQTDEEHTVNSMVLRPSPAEVTFSHKGGKLRCYGSDRIVPDFRLSANYQNADDETAMAKVRISDFDFLLDNPFFGKHETYNDKVTGARRCSTCYLALGTTQMLNPFHIACVIRSEKTRSYDRCNHGTDLDSCEPFGRENRVVCRLWGYSQAMVATFPGVVAHSRKSSRIAIAKWDRIYVWTVDPNHLSDLLEHEGFSVVSSQYYDHDKVWDHNLNHEVVELKPIVLNAESVVRKMIFGESEDQLIALTSTGLQLWNMGPSGTGKRSTAILEEKPDEQEGDFYMETVEAIQT